MTNYKPLLATWKIIFLFIIFIFNGQSIIAQGSHTLKLTPLNFVFGRTNLGYEWISNNGFAIGTDIQFWYQDQSRTTQSYWGGGYKRVNRTNQGRRASLEIRQYFQNENSNSDKRKENFNLGLSIYTGKHYLRKTDSSISTRRQPSTNETVIYDTTVNSGGIGLHIGYGVFYKDGLMFNIELIGRLSKVENNKLDLPRIIDGKTVEPRCSIGYNF